MSSLKEDILELINLGFKQKAISDLSNVSESKISKFLKDKYPLTPTDKGRIKETIDNIKRSIAVKV